MAIKPMLFNTEMVRALLAGRKTCTRRVVKPRFGGSLEVHEDVAGTPRLCEKCGTFCHGLKPPCRPGDILYVRETWAAWSRTEGLVPAIHYKADGDNLRGVKWRPSIHMPKEAARIFLRVTDVRVERLQDITTVGLQAEGILPAGYLSQFATMTSDCFEQWKDLWDSTIKPADLDRYGWAANPFCWVISFERISKDEAMQ